MPITEEQVLTELSTAKREGFRSDQVAHALREAFKNRPDVYVICENPLEEDSILCGNPELDLNTISTAFEMTKDHYKFICIPYGIMTNNIAHMISLVIVDQKTLYMNDSDPSGSESSFKSANEELLNCLEIENIKNGINYRDLSFQVGEWECGVHAYLNSIDIIDKITAHSEYNIPQNVNNADSYLQGETLDEAAKKIIRSASRMSDLPDQSPPSSSEISASAVSSLSESNERSARHLNSIDALKPSSNTR